MGITTGSSKLQYPILPGILNTLNGGTGGTTVLDAVSNLGGISIDKLGVLNGIAVTDNDGILVNNLIPPGFGNKVKITGPLSVPTNSVTTFNITNYNSFLTYNIHVNNGHISRSNDIITFTAPSSVGSTIITVNNRTIVISITQS